MHPDCGTSSSFTKRADLGDPEFLAGIPNEWIDQAVLDLILWPMKDSSAPYPAWQVPARANGSPMLYEWWKGGPAPD